MKPQNLLAIAAALFLASAPNSLASPIIDREAALKSACVVIHTRLKTWPGKCEALNADLKGEIWTVYEIVEGIPDYRPPVVKIRKSDGRMLDFYLTQ